MRVRLISLVIAGLTVTGCAALPFATPPGSGPRANVQIPGDATMRPLARPGQRTADLGQSGRSPEALDTTTTQARDAALAVSDSTGAALGETLASLGSPTEQGFWMRTGLVTHVQTGRVERSDGGGALRVELRPSGGPASSGSQLSLAAFRALDAPLTQLLPLRVFAE